MPYSSGSAGSWKVQPVLLMARICGASVSPSSDEAPKRLDLIQIQPDGSLLLLVVCLFRAPVDGSIHSAGNGGRDGDWSRWRG